MTVTDAQATTSQPLAPDEARRTAREAYLHLYSVVQNYLSIYQFALDPKGSQYKGPPNQVNNVARVFTPADTGVITPNSDTPYSFLVMVLRAEPLVVSLPPVEGGRYYPLQLVDPYTHNVDYAGTRVDGNGGGSFLIAGPNWAGDTPAGITRLVRMPTDLAFGQFRTQLFDDADIAEVKKVQGGYRAEPLSARLRTPPPPPAPTIDFPEISAAVFEPRFWSYANFLLLFCRALAGEERRQSGDHPLLRAHRSDA